MKTLLIGFLLLFGASAQADVKISQLPLGSAAAATGTDSFPFVNSGATTTERMLLFDLINLQPFQSEFSVLVPSQGGNSGKFLTTNGSATSWATVSGTGTVTSVAQTVPAEFSISGSPITTSGTLAINKASQSANTGWFGPTSGGATAPTFRSLVVADLPNPYGTSSFTSNAPVIGNGSGALTVGSRSGNTTTFGTTTGSLTSGHCAQFDASGNLVDAGAACSAGGGGSVTSVGLSDASTTPIYSISGSPVTTSGTLGFTLITETANSVFAGPTSGGAAQPSFRKLVGADMPAPGASSLGGVESITCSANGWISTISTGGAPSCTQPAFSNLSGTVDLTSQVAGTLPVGNGGLGVTNPTAHSVLIGEGASATSNTGAGAVGTVLQGKGASVDPGFSAIPQLGVSGATQGQVIFESATSGAVTLQGSTASITSYTLSFPSSVGNASQVLTGDGHGDLYWSTGGGGGAVSSVALSDGSSTPIYTISGSPVISSGTLTFTLSTETANKVFAGATSGGAAQPTFRSLVGADLPNPAASTLGGVESYAAVTHQWINTISTSGVPSSTQPAFTDISGQNTVAQVRNISGSRTAPNSVTAGGGVAASATAWPFQTVYVQGSGGAVTVTANPQISNCSADGQELIVIGESDTNTLTLADGNGLSLNGSMILYQNSNLHLYCNGLSWVEVSRRP